MKNRIRLSLLLLTAFLFTGLSHAQTPALANALMLYPDTPGASQTCIAPVNLETGRYKIALGSQLMLISATSESECKLFVISKQRIRVAGMDDDPQNLCVNVGAGARNGIFNLENCDDVSVTGWEVNGTSTSSSRVRSLGGVFNNQCFTIPSLANPRAKFPLPILPATCMENAAEELKFFVE